ncbi:hypothetical protein G210_5935 [Candida maltosa Xu316]|uniref:Uncharacterized protein n=1 Tax=Candida maltosa (strain Xu316) TaxID=1245528 RepID=M3K3J7_CANMX|nr:hypothetical protein G210_5935 [Candida maltosa Xu316]
MLHSRAVHNVSKNILDKNEHYSFIHWNCYMCLIKHDLMCHRKICWGTQQAADF